MSLHEARRGRQLHVRSQLVDIRRLFVERAGGLLQSEDQIADEKTDPGIAALRVGGDPDNVFAIGGHPSGHSCDATAKLHRCSPDTACWCITLNADSRWRQ